MLNLKHTLLLLCCFPLVANSTFFFDELPRFQPTIPVGGEFIYDLYLDELKDSERPSVFAPFYPDGEERNTVPDNSVATFLSIDSVFFGFFPDFTYTPDRPLGYEPTYNISISSVNTGVTIASSPGNSRLVETSDRSFTDLLLDGFEKISVKFTAPAGEFLESVSFVGPDIGITGELDTIVSKDDIIKLPEANSFHLMLMTLILFMVFKSKNN